MPAAVPSKNGPYPSAASASAATSVPRPSSSSSSSKIFSRTSSIFVSNRKRAEAKEKAALTAATLKTSSTSTTPAPTTTTTTTTTANTANNTATNTAAAATTHIPTPPAAGITTRPLKHSASPPIAEHSTGLTPDPPTPGQTDTSKQPAHSRDPSDTSLPPTLIPTRTSSKSSKRTHRHSHSATNIDLGHLRRSISLRSVSSPHKHAFYSHHSRAPSSTSSGTAAEASTPSLQSQSSRSLLHIPGFAKRQRSADALSALAGSETIPPLDRVRSNPAAAAATTTTTTNTMPAVQYRAGQAPTGRPPAASISSVNTSYTQSSNGLGSTMQVPPPVAGLQTPQMVYQHIMDTASKRISTLDYLRKAHEGRVYWFNTLLFTKPDLLKFSYFQPAKLARRAANYLLLGFSLPTILDLNSQTPTEYLKALNALLVEFEQYQQLHPPDGSVPSSLSRARVPQMFKRNTGKGRRQSSATDFSSHLGSTPEGAPSFLNTANATMSDNLLPQESYQHLLTPSLPFDPDFFETFATLCDVLIDCYTKVTQLIRTPEMCAGNVGELFGKADARVRKVIVAGVVREFEERCREGVKSEVAGVGKVVLGGLM